jgi:membrane protein implicated in regulation of membrane protease activity
MRYTVVLSLALFIASVALLTYYVVVVDDFRFIINTANMNLDIVMLMLTVLSGILAAMVYIFNSDRRGRDVQAVQSGGGEGAG